MKRTNQDKMEVIRETQLLRERYYALLEKYVAKLEIYVADLQKKLHLSEGTGKKRG